MSGLLSSFSIHFVFGNKKKGEKQKKPTQILYYIFGTCDDDGDLAQNLN